MRKPSPDDMIYAGLALRLGLTTEEELKGFSMNASYKDKSFIEIMLGRGVYTPEQHAGIQNLLTQMAGHALFKTRGLGGAALKGEIDQEGLPTVIQGAGQGIAFQPLRAAGPAVAPEVPAAPTAPSAPLAPPPSAPKPTFAPLVAPASALKTTPAPAGPAEIDTRAASVFADGNAPTRQIAGLGAPGEWPTEGFNAPTAGASSATPAVTADPFATAVLSEATVVVSGKGSSPATGFQTGTDWSTLSSSVTREDIDLAQRAMDRLKDNLIGNQIGGCVLLDKLGRGGMGDVYLAKHIALNRYVALKILPRSLARDPEFVQRFLKEAQTLARINHASVIQVFDVGVDGSHVYFTMELAKGRTLQELIRENGTVPLPLALNIIKQCCRALARVSREGIIHRDIKPANILLTDEGEVKVCDFGIAFQRVDQKAIGEIAGTPYYIAPELLIGEPATSDSDQYSLGVTFHHMLAGVPNHPPTGMLESVKPLEPLSSLNSAIPEEISQVVARMTDPGPGNRYRRFAEIYRIIENYELKKGIVKAPSEFLAERLMEMRDAGLAQFKQWVGAMTLAAAGLTGLAMFAHNILAKTGPRWVGVAGGVGSIMIFLAYAMILYVGLARKKLLPALGGLRQWVRVHYGIALVGYFFVMIHSGNFIASASVKKAIAVIPGLGAADWGVVPSVPFLASWALFVVIVSGLVGRYIFHDLHKQLALSRFGGKKDLSAEERQDLTRLVIGTRFMSYWRILHYPITFLMILLVILHIVSALFYGGAFFGGK